MDPRVPPGDEYSCYLVAPLLCFCIVKSSVDENREVNSYKNMN